MSFQPMDALPGRKNRSVVTVGSDPVNPAHMWLTWRRMVDGVTVTYVWQCQCMTTYLFSIDYDKAVADAWLHSMVSHGIDVAREDCPR